MENRVDTLAASVITKSGNQTISGNLTVTKIIGDGSGLTNLSTNTSNSLILTSPDGSTFKVIVDNSGNLSTTRLTTGGSSNGGSTPTNDSVNDTTGDTV